MREIRIGIVGVGNCASALVQGIEYYAGKKGKRNCLRFDALHEICGYTAEHIKVVAAFDIDKKKGGRPLREAIFSPPQLHEEDRRRRTRQRASLSQWGTPSTGFPTT